MKIIVILLFITCQLYSQSLIVIDAKKAKEESIPLSSFASKVEYVALETTAECLLHPSCRYYLTDKYIVAVSMFEAAFLFDRKTGQYIHRITQKGQAPGEFFFKCEDQCGLKNDVLYINNDKYWEGIHIETKKIVERISKPISVYHSTYNFISNPWPYQDSLYIGYINNITGQTEKRLAIFNSAGIVLKDFDNPVIYDHPHHDKPFFHGVYYEYDGQTFFRQYQGNDTVFCLNGYSIAPHIVFEWNDDQMRYQRQPVFSENQIYMSYFLENDDFIIYDCQVNGPFVPKETYQCFFRKKTKRLKSTRKRNSGFVDDIDHLGEVCPVVATNRELVDVIPAEEWLEWTKQSLKMPIDLKVDFDDNPIIRIVHVKGL